jgi:hypothetical protein
MTQKEANELWQLYLNGELKLTNDIAQKIVDAWNTGVLKVNFLGGVGFHVNNGRICHNSK